MLKAACFQLGTRLRKWLVTPGDDCALWPIDHQSPSVGGNPKAIKDIDNRQGELGASGHRQRWQRCQGAAFVAAYGCHSMGSISHTLCALFPLISLRRKPDNLLPPLGKKVNGNRTFAGSSHNAANESWWFEVILGLKHQVLFQLNSTWLRLALGKIVNTFLKGIFGNKR